MWYTFDFKLWSWLFNIFYHVSTICTVYILISSILFCFCSSRPLSVRRPKKNNVKNLCENHIFRTSIQSNVVNETLRLDTMGLKPSQINSMSNHVFGRFNVRCMTVIMTLIMIIVSRDVLNSEHIAPSKFDNQSLKCSSVLDDNHLLWGRTIRIDQMQANKPIWDGRIQ